MRKMRIFERDTYTSVDFLHQTISIYKRTARGITRANPQIKKVEPLKLELKHFVNCVLKKHKPLVSGKPAKEALQIALQISRKINKQK